MTQQTPTPAALDHTPGNCQAAKSSNGRLSYGTYTTRCGNKAKETITLGELEVEVCGIHARQHKTSPYGMEVAAYQIDVTYGYRSDSKTVRRQRVGLTARDLEREYRLVSSAELSDLMEAERGA